MWQRSHDVWSYFANRFQGKLAVIIKWICISYLSQNKHVHSGVWGLSGTYGAFTPFMYLPVRIFSQQNQDSPFKLGVLTIIAGHSGM